MWESCDKFHYHNMTSQEIGQICNDSFSMEIEKYASDPMNKTFLEVGTWNGLGSTKAFYNGLSKRTDEFQFYSLECNKDKSDAAAKLYAHNDKIHILNEVLWNEEPSNFYDIFPQCKEDARYRHWNEVDIMNMKRCDLFLERPGLPDIFDVVLLDGGEFTTYYEFQLLKERCRILMLDDTESDKCKLIVKELRDHPSVWRILKEEKVRNGYVIAERLTNVQS